MPTLTVESGPHAGKVFSFNTHAVLGRGQLADVQLEDAMVSRRHSEIRPAESGWEIADLGSANGTRLNGELVAGTQPLREGDLVQLGPITLRFALVLKERRGMASGFTSVGERPAPSALFGEVLSRIKLFCEIGVLPVAPEPAERQIGKALEAMRRAFPLLDRTILLRNVRGSDRFTVAATVGAGPGLSFAALAPRALEALRHERGRIVVGEEAGGGVWAALPVRFAGESLGVLYLDSDKEPEALRVGDRDALAAVAGILGCLLAPSDPARDADAANERDLALARRIQQRFLPQSPPLIEGYSVIDSYTAARVIGGDHFDYLTLADGRTLFVVADVAGKALSGALYMARLGLLLRYSARDCDSPGALLSSLNRQLYNELESGMFVTMLALALDPRSGRIELASAGHPAPLRRASGGDIAALPVPAGLPLGAMAEPRFEPHFAELAPGELLLLYTDGLDEAHDAQQQQFGLERVRAVLAATPRGADLVDGLLRELGRFVGTEAQSDDLTLVVLERLP